MNLDEITEKIAAFEREQPVHEWVCHGWHVWPALRLALFFDLGGQPLRPPPRDAVNRMRRRLSGALRFAATLARPRRAAQRPDRVTADAVIVTYADRVVNREGTLCHTVADPMVEALRDRGLRAAVWEVGRPRRPRREQPLWISEPLRHACRLIRVRGQAPAAASEPAWFRVFAQWVKGELKRPCRWSEWEPNLRHITIRAEVMRRWLAAAGCRALLLDCWYNGESLSAELAAARLGIPKVDVQHGLHGHPYRAWHTAPPNGYEIMPDHLWVWGDDVAETLVRDNPGFIGCDQVFAAGHLWINRWRSLNDADLRRQAETARALTRDAPRSVLVTLQRSVPFEETLLPLITASPRDWHWLVRPHRQDTRSRTEIEQAVRSTGHPGINVHDAADLPLHALLRAVDVHVTGYSTCAVEALAFGTPTVLLHPNGPSTHGKYIEAGVMRFASQPEEALTQIEACAEIDPDRVRDMSRACFADPEQSRREIDRLLQALGLAGDQP